MAGVKGRSGGARAGAGRPPKRPCMTVQRDPLEFLLDVMEGRVDPSPAQMQAAIAAAQYMHAKAGSDGKKGQRKQAAAEVAGGKFKASEPPRLALVK